MYGGIPSPSPDYPQDMRVVTGDNQVIVQNANLLDLSQITEGYLVAITGALAPNANYGASGYIPVKANQSYCQNNTNTWYACFYDMNKNFVSQVQNQVVITPSVDGYVRVSFLLTNRNVVSVNKGNTPIPYVKGEYQFCPLNLGMRNYFTASIELGTLNDSTGATETNNNIIRSNDFIRVTPNGTYSINNDKGYHTYIYEYNSSKTFLSAITTDTSNPKTFKASNSTRYIKIRTAEGENDTTAKFWLNNGDRASDTYYPPNTAPIRLFGIGDSNDLIIGKPDNWKVLRVIRELNLFIDDMDNIENYPGWQNQLQLVDDLGLTSSNTRLEEATQLLNNIGATYLYANANNSGTFWIDRNSFGNEYTQTYWKTNYPGLIFQLHYRITNPTAIVEEPITIPIVVEQLNNIYNLTSYDGQTNITVTHKPGSAQMIISASVEKGE